MCCLNFSMVGRGRRHQEGKRSCGRMCTCKPGIFGKQIVVTLNGKISVGWVCQKAKRVCCCESSLKEGFFRLWRGTNAANAVALLTVRIYLPCYDILPEKLEASASESTPRLKP
ncbi:hypothetical protein R1flu_014075 [Riccia fluitans]|uniref:Uncharacterized protein n=1 Tax=Riccia fluitans TaxID=41844 RepID=A0ABD1YF19_9MARC